MPVTVSEAEFRGRILSAVAVLRAEGRPITLATLRRAGARGNERRLMKTVQALVVERAIPTAVWNQGRDVRLILDETELAAREQSAEWVAEHRARWARIRRIGEKNKDPDQRGRG